MAISTSAPYKITNEMHFAIEKINLNERKVGHVDPLKSIQRQLSRVNIWCFTMLPFKHGEDTKIEQYIILIFSRHEE